MSHKGQYMHVHIMFTVLFYIDEKSSHHKYHMYMD